MSIVRFISPRTSKTPPFQHVLNTEKRARCCTCFLHTLSSRLGWSFMSHFRAVGTLQPRVLPVTQTCPLRAGWGFPCDKVNTSESTPRPGAATPHVSSGRGWICGAELCAHGGASGEKLPCWAAHSHHALRTPFDNPQPVAPNSRLLD